MSKRLTGTARSTSLRATRKKSGPSCRKLQPEVEASRENSGRLGEGEIVIDHCARPDWSPSRVGDIEFAEDDFVGPDLAEKILEYLDGSLLAAA
jgi:hypothetical protein